MITSTPSLSLCLQDEDSQLSEESKKELLDIQIVFNFLDNNENVDIYQISAMTGFTLDRFNYLMGHCVIYCNERGLKRWYINSGTAPIHSFAQKLNERNGKN